jgi:hypothetical protein
MSTLELTFLFVTALALLGLFLISKNNRKLFVYFLLWGAVSSLLAWNGFFSNTQSIPPRFVLIILMDVVLVVYAFKYLKFAPKHLKILLAINVLRIPVEMVLMQLFLEGLIPEIMTYEGWNFDIVSGIGALILLILSFTKIKLKQVVRIWNVLALILLATIVSLAILSAPTPIQQLAFDQPNVAVLRVPYVCLPAVVVPVVLISQIGIFQFLNRHELE